jgi:tetratricopeptide (TPR) repeat protein
MSKVITFVVACTLVSQAFAQTPAPSAESLYQQGQAAEKANDPVAAENHYRNALKANPNHANARYSLGQLKLNSAALVAKGREAKFGAVVIPVFQLDQATLQEALDALATKIEKESKGEVVPNIVIEDPKGAISTQKISLNLKAMPARGVLKYLLDQVGAKARYDEHAVVVMAK